MDSTPTPPPGESHSMGSNDGDAPSSRSEPYDYKFTPADNTELSRQLVNYLRSHPDASHDDAVERARTAEFHYVYMKRYSKFYAQLMAALDEDHYTWKTYLRRKERAGEEVHGKHDVLVRCARTVDALHANLGAYALGESMFGAVAGPFDGSPVVVGLMGTPEDGAGMRKLLAAVREEDKDEVEVYNQRANERCAARVARAMGELGRNVQVE